MGLSRYLARASSRRPWRTIGIWLVAVVTSGVITSNLLGDALTTDVDLLNQPEAKRAQTLLEGCGDPSATSRW